MKDYYAVLGVSSTAHDTEIRRIYRRLAVQYHPDKNPDPQAQEFMREINEAYDVLGDAARRRAYDMERHQGWAAALGVEPEPPPAPAHRDPAYRRRRQPRPAAGHKASKPVNEARLEMMTRALHYTRWANVAALVFTMLLALDYVLPYQVIEARIEGYSFHRPTRSADRFKTWLNLSNGVELKVYDYGPTLLTNEANISYQQTRIFGTPMYLRTRTIEVEMGYPYDAVVWFPVVLFVTALAGMLRRDNTEFFFNTSIVAGVLLVITQFIIW